MLVHASDIDKHEERNAMRCLRDQIGQWVYPVHRLDKATSGVLLFAKNGEIAKLLSEQFETRSVEKKYVALVRGWAGVADEHDIASDAWLHSSLNQVFVDWGAQSFPIKLCYLNSEFAPWTLVDKPLAKPKALWSRGERLRDQKRELSAEGLPAKKPAQTRYSPRTLIEVCHAVDRYPAARYSLLDVNPLTGRPHQIRRHLKFQGYPIIGDRKYGKTIHNDFFSNGVGVSRLMLAAYSLTIDHPIKGGRLTIRSLPGGLFTNLFQ